MAYFSRMEAELQLSPAIIGKVFGSGGESGWGEISETSGSLRFDQMAEQASGYVDAFLEPAGYTVPLATPSAFVKRCAMFRFIADVYALAELPINEQLLDTINRNDSLLHDIATGKIVVADLSQEVDVGTGGHVFTSATGSLAPQFSRNALGGTFL